MGASSSAINPTQDFLARIGGGRLFEVGASAVKYGTCIFVMPYRESQTPAAADPTGSGTRETEKVGGGETTPSRERATAAKTKATAAAAITGGVVTGGRSHHY